MTTCSKCGSKSDLGFQTHTPVCSIELGCPEIPMPEHATDVTLSFLDRLRNKGTVNMVGAVPYIRAKFDALTIAEATDVLIYWIKTYAFRHPVEA